MIYDLRKQCESYFNRVGALAMQKYSQLRGWRSSSSLKVLLITERSRIPQSQIFPFFYFSDAFGERWNAEFREIPVDVFESDQFLEVVGADRVFFQPWFDKGAPRIVKSLEKIRDLNPNAKIAFFDSYAPTDLRLAEVVDPYIHWYVKKHVFKNRADYLKPTLGDTTLVEYYTRLYDLPEEEQILFPVPEGFFDKLIVGPSFFTSPVMLPQIAAYPHAPNNTKTINVHARLGARGSPWYQAMRSASLNACGEANLKDSIVTAETVSGRQYMRELKAARVCFSPFGYGEGCWRDYEAVWAGALLIKPDMSHIETRPDIFEPYKTYVPIAWDFSDFAEKVSYYLEHEDLQREIAENAFNRLHQYLNSDAFIDQYAQLFG